MVIMDYDDVKEETDKNTDDEEDIWLPLNPTPQKIEIISPLPDVGSTETKLKTRIIRRDVDKGWAWVVLAANFLTYFIMQGQSFTGNIYFVIYLQVFQQSRSYTALAGSTYTAALAFIGPFTSYLLIKWGPRVVMMLGSLLMAISFALVSTAQSMLEVIIYASLRGAGSNFVICSCQAALSKYFTKRLYMATGIMYSASALGMTAVAYITDYSVREYGWRGSLLIQAALSLQILVTASVIYQLPKDPPLISAINDQQNGFRTDSVQPAKKKLVIKKYFTDVLFWLGGLSATFLFIFMTIIFQFWKDILPNKDHFKYAIIAMAVGSTVGRVTAGLISKLISPSLHNSAVTFVCAVAVMIFLVADQIWIVVVQSIVWGFCNGQHIVSDRLQMTWVFGGKEVATVVGLTFALAGAGGVTMLPLAGYLTDVTGNYTATLSLCAAVLFMASMNSVVIFIIKKRRLKEEERKKKKVNFSIDNGTEMTAIRSN